MENKPTIYLTDIDRNIYPLTDLCTPMHFSYAHGQLENITGYDIIYGNIEAIFLLSHLGEHECVAVDIEGNKYNCILFVGYDKIKKCNRGLVCLSTSEEIMRTRQTMEIFKETGIL
jgi:hypothetical protein